MSLMALLINNNMGVFNNLSIKFISYIYHWDYHLNSFWFMAIYGPFYIMKMNCLVHLKRIL